MKVATICERPPESRVALTPSLLSQYKRAGFSISCEDNAGSKAGFPNPSYTEHGASVGKLKTVLPDTNLLLCVNPPSPRVLKYLAPGCIILTQIDEDQDSNFIKSCLKHSLSLINMNKIPRISRAQAMDVLSSQSNLAGYKAVVLAVNTYQRAVPMMMTAAGMIHPAKVLVLGAGVAGLQAIATAKRLGAAVSAFDVRQAAREQVESLGAEFIEVSAEDLETADGYASETSEHYQKLQAALIDEHARTSDIIITTALIPNRPAPKLIHASTIKAMKPGSVIVDMATARGGNCAYSIKDSETIVSDIHILGYSNLAGMLPTTASELYANNLFQFTKLLIKNDTDSLCLDPEDAIIQQTLICHDGQNSPWLKTENRT
ncbi:MAG: NAD(P) transhydrogenase subunit alpha [Legionellaceae bacterium]|nr:NAD(P) transhydrogenase subunit alpha [Legionellaceae bacterium]